MFIIYTLIFALQVANAKICASYFKTQSLQNKEVVFVTGNPKKQNTIQWFLERSNINASFKNDDVAEITANSLNVAIHKATSVYEPGKITVIDDTSLHIEDANIGPLIKWHVHKLDQYIGRKAKLEVIFAYYIDGRVKTFHASLNGSIQSPTDKGRKGIDSYFVPDGYNVNIDTLRKQEVYDNVNPRLLALEKLFKDKADYYSPAIYNWPGPWQ